MREEVIAIYDRIIDGIQEFDRKGKTMPYTSANGYMFSQVNKDAELGIRMPTADGKKFMEEHNTGQFMSYGAKIRDYVTIPPAMLSEEDKIRDLLIAGFKHVMSLPPK